MNEFLFAIAAQWECDSKVSEVCNAVYGARWQHQQTSLIYEAKIVKLEAEINELREMGFQLEVKFQKAIEELRRELGWIRHIKGKIIARESVMIGFKQAEKALAETLAEIEGEK